MDKNVGFSVNGEDWEAVFRYGYSNSLHRQLVTCILIKLPRRICFSGAAMKHPRDVYDEDLAELLAFRRAASHYWLLDDYVRGVHSSTEQICKKIKEMQKAMGKKKYELFGKM